MYVVRGESLNTVVRGESLNTVVRGESLNTVVRGESLNTVVRGESLNTVVCGESLNMVCTLQKSTKPADKQIMLANKQKLYKVTSISRRRCSGYWYVG
jgi:hypothetical protein